jgi:hypothetical protein
MIINCKDFFIEVYCRFYEYDARFIFCFGGVCDSLYMSDC